DARIAFDLWVGGGLGAKEHFARRLGVHIFPEEVVEVCHHITAIFRDHGNREFRTRARLKFLMAEWGPERFRTELESRLGRSLVSGDAPHIPVLDNRAHLGTHAQRQRGLFYIGAASKGGLFSGTQMLQVARAARLSGSDRIRLTTAQNLVVLDVPEKSCLKLEQILGEIGLQVRPSPFRTGTIACTGKQFCKLAVTETKDRAAEIIAHLEEVLPEFNEPLRISVTGCPNSCAHYQICDIGLVGDLIRTPEGKVDAFRIYLGGHLGDGYSFGRELKTKVRAEYVRFYIEQLIRVYLEKRVGTESFQAFIARHEAQDLEHLVVIEQLTELLTAAEAA
ncbi:MAG: nitrite/sulfite reductase, partial [Pyrinomonadaceae bacterium]